MATNLYDLIDLGRAVSTYCVGLEGNVSMKCENHIFIKASGSKLKDLSPNNIVGFTFEGEQISNHKKRGSMELGFHTFLLGIDGIKFVAHTHPINCVKILSTNHSKIFADKRIFPDQVIFNGKKSCFVPYAKPGDELTEKIKECVNDFTKNEGYFPKLILLQNHGIISCGESVEECILISDICEKSAEIFLGSMLLGDFNPLNESDVDNLLSDEKEKYRKNLIK